MNELHKIIVIERIIEALETIREEAMILNFKYESNDWLNNI